METLPKPGKSRRVRNRADQYDTINLMKKVAIESAQEPYFIALCKKYALKNDIKDLEKIFYFSFYNTYFQSDNPKIQEIRSGIRTLDDQIANCVDYCILISSFLQNINVPHSFRMVSLNASQPENYSHIYVVTNSGIAIDPVVGQDQTGDEYLKNKDERKPDFGYEVPYIQKKDLKIY